MRDKEGVIYRVFFADGGRIDLHVDAVSVRAGWDVAVQRALDCEYNGHKRNVAQITVVIDPATPPARI